MSISVKRRTNSNGVVQMEVAAPPPPSTAPSSASFFQTSLQIIDRLSCIPGFDYYLDPEYLTAVADTDIPTIDPVTTLWCIFRIGNALCELVNIGRPQNPVPINADNSLASLNLCKKSVFHFLVACKNDFGIRSEDVFAISELYQQDTNGFVKVLKTVSLVLDYLEREGLVDTSNPRPHRFSDLSGSSAPMDNRAKVVRELLETERSYIRDLEMLQNYHREVQRDGRLSPDNMLYLFANLNELVDFQRKFLIGVEANAIHSPEEQHFGDLFLQMEESFAVYEPFCANYERASKIVEEQVAILMRYSHIMEPQRQLLSFLIKPIQRICKYPLLLQELIKSSDKEMANYAETQEGLASIKRVADRVNETRRNVENQMIVKDLEKRIKGWHEHAAQSFGELLLHDKFVMSSNEVEKELMVYLFENIMICCKEAASKKNKKKSSTSLQLKGRIFISSITGVVNYSRNGIYALKVLWRDAQMGNFSLRCRNDEQLRMWYTTLERLINEPAEPLVEERRPSAETLQTQRQPTPAVNNARLRSAPGGLSGEQLPNIYTNGRVAASADRPVMAHGGGPANGAGQRYPVAGRTPGSASVPLRPGGGYVSAADQIKIKVNYMDDVYVISVPNNVSYRELLSKLEKKIRICGGEIPNGAEALKIQYFDEDGDRVTIKNDEDVQTSFESRDSANAHAVLNFFVS
ncbi:Dbl homology domain-containing protein [Syncephalis pseudoplumigaleata]|uniref:Dbl homology domain-containing protein n=1 Tax=Syncephalis pseudoplumigaleata TaxID=1712513 RepID=A0A4P9Z6B9_9FUNG|nr:Dbl homology domain-containing protein [Syncephalis pseudoplumigaleata]|eukprot:RKP28125.1 Dbl homology domain-containing protein [Syncephalis pseudoplumigaleata]